MDNIREVLQAIKIGLVVASFLINTSRGLQAIKLYKECLILLKTNMLGKVHQITTLAYRAIIRGMIEAYCAVSDYTNAERYAGELLLMSQDSSDTVEEGKLSLKLAQICQSQNKFVQAKQYYQKAINITKTNGDRQTEANCYGNLATLFHSLSEYHKARHYIEKALAIRIEIGDRKGEATDYGNLGTLFRSLCEYDKAKEYHEKALAIRMEIGDREGEAADYGNLGTLFHSLGEYDKAIDYTEKALAIRMKIGHREGEATCCGNLGVLFQSLGEYDKAKEYHEKAIAIRIEIGDRNGEAADYGNLGDMFRSLGEYDKAKDYIEKALAIRIEIGDQNGEAVDYSNLGTLFHLLGEYDKAKDYIEKALAIRMKIGDKKGEAVDYGNLGTIFHSLGEYDKAKDFTEKALAITMKIGDKQGKADNYGSLGPLFQSLGEYDKAKDYIEKALAIRMEIGDRKGEAADYGHLGVLFQSLGEYDKAKEYHEKALAIKMEIGDRKGEADDYANLGMLFHSLGEYVKANEYHEKALAIRKKIGDKNGEAASYGHLGTLFHSLGEYDKAKEYHEKALAIRMEIGYRAGEAVGYGHLGALFRSLGEYDKAKEFLKKALAIRKEIGFREGEVDNYLNLGSLFRSLGEYVVAEEYFDKALSLSRHIGDNMNEFKSLCGLTVLRLSQSNLEEAFLYLLQCIEKLETLRNFLKDNDHFKISLLEKHGAFPYKLLSKLLSTTGNSQYALYVEELGRARALADLLAEKYFVEQQISGNPQSWYGIQNIIKKESNCSCLYLLVDGQDVRFWILKTSGNIHFREVRKNPESIGDAGFVPNFDEDFTECFQRFAILPKENCEDRYLNADTFPISFHVESRAPLQRDKTQDMETSLSLCYKMILAPVTDLLKEPEIIIVPDKRLWQVPFAALRDERGKYLSDTFRIRIIPSLTTLKLIQDSPPDYHSQTGALVVGDPEVGEVMYKGGRMNLQPLPFARNEAELVGKLLAVTPLLGKRATKQAVLQQIKSVALIHFAAHGNAERGEIALSPVRTTNRIPQEEDYLLTMSDISQVQLRAKLVVLSCCHSARGEIKAEGVIGIARAFLGSGARSVLVARWALDDQATEQFMSRFYEHVVGGKSASESLHEARKWMRSNGFDKVSQWAPFMLIGDNVKTEFGKGEKSLSSKDKSDP